MNNEQFLKNLKSPKGKVDVVLDTDAYNEIDDQYAIGYLLANKERLNIKGICAAPFFNHHSESAEDGMLRSYDEIIRLLDLAGRNDLVNCVYKGSRNYLVDEDVPIESEAADFMAQLANDYTPEKPLYIVAIGAITNVASAILKNPAIAQNAVVVWLGGNAFHVNHNNEFNMVQDFASARIVFDSGVPLVQLPCFGVVDRFTTSRYELEHWLSSKNKYCDYLLERTVTEAQMFNKLPTWTRVIWDVTAVAWLLNDDDRFMVGEIRSTPLVEYDKSYSFVDGRHVMNYINSIRRDALFADLFEKLGDL